MSAILERPLRAVERVLGSEIAPVGTFTVRRALPARDRHAIGPWVFLDHFGPFRVTPGHDGVGPHPHAGIETVTYLLSGRNEHRDSAGHTGIVAAGGAQWMTAGRGIIHAERPLAERESELMLHGIQLWTSLPRLLKLGSPGYQRIEADAIASVERDGARLRVVAGSIAGVQGPAKILMPLVLAHLTLAPGAVFEAAVPEDFEMGAYMIHGEAQAGGDPVAKAGELVVFAQEGRDIRLENRSAQPAEAMLFGGTPAEGPLVFHGPFVMNNVEQVRAAEVAYRTGRMGSLEE
jgi:redox-sensitive bicupin YhaK (pirin superfamily)